MSYMEHVDMEDLLLQDSEKEMKHEHELRKWNVEKM